MSRDQHELHPERRAWVRTRPVKTLFRPPEHQDLQTIAEAWGVPVATAVWAIVAGELARFRREAPNYGQAGLAIAAATTVLRLRGKEAASGAAGEKRPSNQ